VTGLRSLVVIVAVVFGALRLVHVALPLVFPDTRQGPLAIATLDEVRGQAGFAPLLPAYRPAALGERPSVTLTYTPWPTVAVVWRQGDQFLSVTQRRGGPRPAHPPLARQFEDIAGSLWWTDEAGSHLILAHDNFWMQIETSLSARDLRRFADTLAEY